LALASPIWRHTARYVADAEGDNIEAVFHADRTM
jgi:hypothetical protein